MTQPFALSRAQSLPIWSQLARVIWLSEFNLATGGMEIMDGMENKRLVVETGTDSRYVGKVLIQIHKVCLLLLPLVRSHHEFKKNGSSLSLFSWFAQLKSVVNGCKN